MQFKPLFYILSIIISLLACGMTYADTCYDPNYNTYYNCEGDEYIAPVVATVLFSALIYNNNGYNNHGDYNNREHGDHHGNNFHGGHNDNGRHH